VADVLARAVYADATEREVPTTRRGADTWEAQVVRIGTWNLENLFAVGEEDGPDDQAAYDAKLDSLADVIRTIEPDVLAVQEVGNPEALADLAKRVGGDWTCKTAKVEPGQRPIRVGYMSRLPINDDDVEEITAFPPGLNPIQVADNGRPASAMGRAALRARIHVGGQPIDLITCHLKSKLLTFPPGPSGRPRFDTDDEGERARYAVYALSRRAAEAAAVRAEASTLLDNDGQERRLVVLGDLNDVPEAATTQILYGPPGSEIGTGGFLPPDEGDGQRLWNLALRIPADQRFSRRHRGRDELIDHILVSHALVHHVADGAVRTDGSGPTPSITEDPRERRGAPGSDHRPVVAEFDV
jgi:endonuclease/exonuclease/phosphatase family metal-dependent hydrolase